MDNAAWSTLKVAGTWCSLHIEGGVVHGAWCLVNIEVGLVHVYKCILKVDWFTLLNAYSKLKVDLGMGLVAN